MRTRVTGALIAFIVVLSSSCASMPFGTMLKLSGYDRDDLATAQPREIRAAVELPDTVLIKEGSTTLRAQLIDRETDAVLFEADATLLQQESGRFVVTSLPRAREDRHWFVYALDEKGIDAFHSFQQELLARHEGETPGGSLSVHFDIDNDVEHRSMPVSVWLKLADDDDWFALLKDAELELKPGDE